MSLIWARQARVVTTAGSSGGVVPISVERGQPANRINPRIASGDLLQAQLERVDLGVEAAEVGSNLAERLVGERVLEPLSADSAAVLDRPRPLARMDAVVAQLLLGDPVSSRPAGGGQVIEAAHQIAQALLLGARRTDEGELAGAVEADELARVAAIGLDPVAGADRNQRGGDDIAGDPDRTQ